MQTGIITIRPVAPDECAALGEIVVAAYAATNPPTPEPDWYVASIRDVATRARESCVLAAVDAEGTVVGGATYVSGPEDPYSEELEPGDAGIRMLGVAPDRQRNGAGRALVEACIARARAAGRHRVVLHTGAYMIAAQRLYERLGFRREPALDWQPLPGIELLGYVLEL